MKNLIIFSHPRKNSYTASVVLTVKNILINKKQEVNIIDLYGEKFNPILSNNDLISILS